MAVTRCPHCTTELDLDDADFGYRVQCPACQSAFTPERPAAAPPPLPPPPPPAPPPPDGTVVVTCPECKGSVSVLTEDVGHDLRCPLCDKVFTAALSEPPRARRRPDADDGDDRPAWRRDRDGGIPRYDDDEYDRPRRRRRSRYDDDDTPDELISHAKRECQAPGVGLIVIACLGLLGGVAAVAIWAAILGGAFPNPNANAGADEEAFINIGASVLQLFVSAFLLYAGVQMRQAKQYPVCLVACIIAVIPVFSPCCILGLIFGIIGLVKLSEQRVKRGFEANKPDFQSDGSR